MRAQKLINIISSILVLFLSASAFILSYDALYRLALANGITHSLAWLWPLCLDAFMVSASLAVLRNSLVSERTWYQWVLVGAFTILSISFNAIHAPSTWLARGIFALPPLVVFLAFELLVSQIKSAVSRRMVSERQARIDTQVSPAANDTTQDDTLLTLTNETRKVQKESRQSQMIGIIAKEPSISYTDIAQRLGVSLPTVKRDMAELIDTGKVRRNGHGLEVVIPDTVLVSSDPVSAATN